uniref:Kinesin motor domain-containing protein n=1 Tax=Picocystis salinarum TaxID=88271 RepID=A0A7S3UDY1_9CHLO
MAERVRVAVRVRPILGDEEGPCVVHAEDGGKELQVLDARSSGSSKSNGQRSRECSRGKFQFDRVFSDKEDSDRVYEDHCRHVVDRACRGYHGTIFAYGQTGTGKTYTMGTIQKNAVRDIFKNINGSSEHQWLVRFSMIEIYNDAVTDVLGDNTKTLRLLDGRKSGTPGVVIEGLSQRVVASEDELLRVIEDAKQKLQVSATKLNRQSSRSHNVMRVIVESQKKAILGDRTNTQETTNYQPIFLSCLNLVDLAGSERVSESKSEGQRLKEAQHINSSLLALGNVINCLADDARHVPFRSSPLTRILEHSLGGNSYTSIICTVSPLSGFHLEQTKSTVQFASRAMRVTNKIKRNELMYDSDKELQAQSLLRQYQQEIEELKTQLQDAGLQKREMKEKERRAKNLGRFLLQGLAIDRAFSTPNKRHSADSYVKPTPTKSANGRHSWVADDADSQADREQTGDLVQFIKAFGKSQRETNNELARSKEEFEYLENIASNLQRKVSESQDIISRQKREVESLKAQLQIVDGHSSSREMQVRDLEEELEFRDNAIKETTELLEKANEQIRLEQASAEEGFKNRDEEVARLHAELKELHDLMAEKDVSLSNLQASLDNAQDQLKVVQENADEGFRIRDEQLRSLESSAKEMDAKMEAQVEKLQETEQLLKKAMEELESERSAAAAGLQSRSSEVSALQAEREELTKKLAEQDTSLEETKKHLEETKQELETERAASASSIKGLECGFNALQAEKETLSQKLTEQESAHVEARQQWEKTRAELEAEHITVARDLENQAAAYQALQVQQEELVNRLADKESELKQSSSTYEKAIEDQQIEQQNQLIDQQQKIKELSEKLHLEQAELQKAADLVASLQAELASEKSASAQSVDELSQQNADLQEKQAALESELSEMQAQHAKVLQERSNERDFASAGFSSRDREIRVLQDHNKELVEKLQANELRLRKSSDLVEKLKQDLELERTTAATGISSRDAELSSVQANLDHAEERLQETQALLSRTQEELENDRQVSEQRIHFLQEEIESHQAVSVANKEKLQAAENTLAERDRLLEITNKSLESERLTAASGMEARDNEILDLKDMLQNAHIDVQKSQSSFETLRGEMEEISIELEESKCRLQVLEKQLEAAKQNEHAKEEEVLHLGKKLASAQAQSESLSDKMKRDTEEAKVRYAELESLTQKLMEQKKQVEESHQRLVMGHVSKNVASNDHYVGILSTMQAEIDELLILSPIHSTSKDASAAEARRVSIRIAEIGGALSEQMANLQEGLSGLIVSASKEREVRAELERLQSEGRHVDSELQEFRSRYEQTAKIKQEVSDRNTKLQKHVEVLHRRLKHLEEEYAEAKEVADSQVRSYEHRMVAAEAALNNQTELLENLRRKTGRQSMDDEGWNSDRFDQGSTSSRTEAPMLANIFNPDPGTQVPDSRNMEKILRLWDELCVPLYHRSRFYGGMTGVHGLRFKEECCQLELNRLSWLKERFYGPSDEQATSMLRIAAAGLVRERQELLRLLRNLSRRTKNLIFAGWGIDVNSKNRKNILMSMLWTTENKAQQSASLVLFLADGGYSPDTEPAGLFFRSHYAMASLGAAMEAAPGGIPWHG